MKKKVLVFAAHPDDELLGPGGTLIKHIAQGDEVSVVLYTTGITSRELRDNDDKIKKLRKNSLALSKFMKFKKIFFLDFDDQKLDTYPLLQVIKKVESIRLAPTLIVNDEVSEQPKTELVFTKRTSSKAVFW